MSETKGESHEEPDYDGAYRRLFGQPALILALLGLLAEHLPALRGQDLRPTNTTFMTRHLQRKHADCIWEVPLVEEPGAAVFLLVEFQSSVQHTMPMRVLEYCALLSLHVFATRAEERDLSAPWPMIIPLVLYNGKDRWSAPNHVLTPRAAPRLARWAPLQPQGGFELWDLGHGELPSLEECPENLALILFWLERVTLQGQPERIDALFDRLLEALELHPERLALQEAFLIFFNAVLRLRGAILPEQRLEQLREARHMFHHLADACEEKGRREGLREGLTEGRKEGQKEAALAIIKHKFGVNGDTWRARLDPMSGEDLQAFLVRIALASSIEDIEG